MMYGLSQLACPRCKSLLFIGQASGVTIHGCGRCGGVWLGAACARRVAEALPGDALELAWRVSQNAKDAVCTKASIGCPVCHAAMTRTHAAAAGVELDVCGVHGTWYDRNELEQIARVLAQSTWRKGGAAGAAAVGAVAGAALAAGAVGSAGPPGSRMQDSAVDTALEVGSEVVLEGGAEVVLEGAGAAIEVSGAAVEAGGSVLEGAFEVLGGILGAIFD